MTNSEQQYTVRVKGRKVYTGDWVTATKRAEAEEAWRPDASVTLKPTD